MCVCVCVCVCVNHFAVYLKLTQHCFPHSSVGKESACNAGDPGLIPGLGRSAGEGRGYPLQYSWASLVAQLVKKLPAMWETWVRFLGWEDPLEKGKATHSDMTERLSYNILNQLYSNIKKFLKECVT